MHKVLDKGFINLIDIMGNDWSIADAARVSYANHDDNEIDEEKDTKLIRYLMRHNHTSPFEMCELKFHIKCPIFIARQWLRHRTASVNEISARYSVIKDEFYVPSMERCKFQSFENNQGSSNDFVDSNLQLLWQDDIYENSKLSNAAYRNMINSGLAKELARTILPQNQYTEFYWKIDLHNLFHFCKLRSDKHAQWEIQQYSKALEKIIKEHFPVAYEAWIDYKRDAVVFSKQEMEGLKWYMKNPGFLLDAYKPSNLSNREWKEFKEKLNA